MTDSISIRADRAALAAVFAEPAWLAEHLNDPGVRVVEVDVSRAAYAQGHIPGAVLWNAYTDLHHADYSPLDRREFEELLSRSGLAPRGDIPHLHVAIPAHRNQHPPIRREHDAAYFFSRPH